VLALGRDIRQRDREPQLVTARDSKAKRVGQCSSAPGAPDDGLVPSLLVQERSWNSRRLVRALYVSWFKQVCGALSPVAGRSIELGSGIGALQQTCPRIEPTDVAPTPWTSDVVDAEALPYGQGSIANLVLVDVFHHLARPTRFLDEAARVLAPKGRIVVLDPYCSPISTLAYRRFHHERTDLSAGAFEDDASIAAAPLASNQARSTLVFFRHLDEFELRWPELVVVERRRLALFAYPLSGGFTGAKLVPDRVGLALARIERVLGFLAPLLGFRCLIVLERTHWSAQAHDFDAELPEREDRHAEEKHSVAPTTDVRGAVCAGLVPDR
jgi:SAM-dependent methyltransferase